MKALSLHQPWAAAVAIGAKRVETRTWRTSYRGRLAIHASAKAIPASLWPYLMRPHWMAALAPVLADDGDRMPYGAIVGVVELVACVPTDTYRPRSLEAPRYHSPEDFLAGRFWKEWQLGDYSPGRFAWELAGAVCLPEPIPCKGHQRIFNLDLATSNRVRLQLHEAKGPSDVPVHVAG